MSILSRFFVGVVGTLAFLGLEAQAADVKCSARVALNQRYSVEIKEESGAMSVVNASGSTWDGVANRFVSGRTGDITWFLAAGFGQGIEVSVENGGQRRVALCLADNECYLCQ